MCWCYSRFLVTELKRECVYSSFSIKNKYTQRLWIFSPLILQILFSVLSVSFTKVYLIGKSLFFFHQEVTGNSGSVGFSPTLWIETWMLKVYDRGNIIHCFLGKLNKIKKNALRDICNLPKKEEEIQQKIESGNWFFGVTYQLGLCLQNFITGCLYALLFKPCCMAGYIKYILFFMCNKKGISEDAFPSLSSAKLGSENWFLGAMLQKLWVLLRNSAFKIQLSVTNCRAHKHSQQDF